MTVEQVALTLIVAIVTAFATSVLNNWFELRRLQSMWKRETDERIAQYRKQRLEQRLASIEHYVQTVLATHYPHDILTLIGRKEALEKLTTAAWALNPAFAIGLAVGDERLTRALQDLYTLSPRTLELLEQKVSSEDTEWVAHSDKVLEAAGVVFGRSDQLLEEVYAQGVRQK